MTVAIVISAWASTVTAPARRASSIASCARAPRGRIQPVDRQDLRVSGEGASSLDARRQPVGELDGALVVGRRIAFAARHPRVPADPLVQRGSPQRLGSLVDQRHGFLDQRHGRGRSARRGWPPRRRGAAARSRRTRPASRRPRSSATARGRSRTPPTLPDARTHARPRRRPPPTREVPRRLRRARCQCRARSTAASAPPTVASPGSSPMASAKAACRRTRSPGSVSAYTASAVSACRKT